MSKSTTMAILPILGCLKAAEEFIQTNTDWIPCNEAQKKFLEQNLKHMPIVDKLGEIIKRKADRDFSVINKWLKDNDFEIQLAKGAPDSFAVASILNVLVEWLVEGERRQISTNQDDKNPTSEKTIFEAVRISKENGAYAFFDNKIHPYPIARITTRSSDLVYMTVVGKRQEDQLELIENIRPALNEPYHIAHVTFPMIDYDQVLDTSWILGLSRNGFSIDQALQQTKFRMNLHGARAKSAVALSLSRSVFSETRPVVVIDKPFLIWIERPGISIPLFTGILGYDSWKEPKDL